jgi:hypothetical protein
MPSIREIGFNIKHISESEYYSYDPKNLHATQIDLYCRWLYQPARADGKPRVLIIGRKDVDYSPVSFFIDRIRQVKVGYKLPRKYSFSGFSNGHRTRQFLHPN